MDDLQGIKTAEANSRQIQLVSQNRKSAFFLFLLHPFSALVFAIKNHRASYAKNVVWLFVIFFGFTFVISNPEMDAERQREYLEYFAAAQVSLDEVIALFYAETGGYVDILQPLILYFVSRFTGSYLVLFAIYGLIFGFFYSRNIWYLLENAGPKIYRLAIPYIVVFAMVVGFWEINGFRMWTAAHIFFYGAIRFLVGGNKWGILVAALSIFVHFSFILLLAPLFLFSIMKNRVRLFYWFFVVSFFVAQLDLEIIRETLLGWLPPAFHEKVTAYTQDAMVERVEESYEAMIWYAQYYHTGLKWVGAILLSVFFFSRLKIIEADKKLLSLLGFSLFLLGIVNFIGHVPSLSRFYTVANLFSIAFVFIYLQRHPIKGIARSASLWAIPALLLFAAVALRIGFDTIGIMAVIGNPILAMLVHLDTALIDVLQWNF